MTFVWSGELRGEPSNGFNHSQSWLRRPSVARWAPLLSGTKVVLLTKKTSDESQHHGIRVGLQWSLDATQATSNGCGKLRQMLALW